MHFATLPGMWERTVTISSAGKTFSATGWQVGWAVGPESLISPVHTLLPYVQFCASTVIQEALARALPRADEPYLGHPSYYDYLRDKYTRKRDLLVSALRGAGFAVPDYERSSGGGFFIFARVTDAVMENVPSDRINALNPAAPGGVARPDWALCQWMAEERGILCIPAGPFFSGEEERGGGGENDDDDDGALVSDRFVRVAFCKTDETIERAAEALLRLKDGDGGGGATTANDDSTEVVEERYVLEEETVR